MSTNSLDALFHPQSIAIIGASANPNRIGYQVVRSLLLGEFPGKIYPINPRIQNLQNLPVYSSVEDIPFDIDLGIIILRKDRVLNAIDSCARKGIPSIIVMSSGYSEIGDITAEQALAEHTQRHGMRMLGPNCAGFAATWEHTYASIENRLQRGHLAFISQSGAMCAVVLALARAANLGFSMFASYGNAVDIGPEELLKFLGGHKPTHIIGCYLEGIQRARDFLLEAQLITPHKPVVVLKPGETSAASRAIQSHTGALAGEQAVYAGGFRQAGVLQTKTLEEFIDVCKILSTQPLPKGNRVAIVTNSGGPGVLAVDACARVNLDVISHPQKLIKKFEAFLPLVCPMNNPVDVGPEGDAQTYQKVIEILLLQPHIDMILVLCVPTPFADIQAISESVNAAKQSNPVKPLVSCWLAEDIVAAGLPILAKANIANFPTPQRAAVALDFLWQRSQWLRHHKKR